MRKKLNIWLIRFFTICILTIVCVVGIWLYDHFGFVKVPSPSMNPTIPVNSIVFVWKNDDLNLIRGDIVVFLKDNVSYVKRIVGMPNETLQILNGITYINGNPIHEHYLNQSMLPDSRGPFTIPEESYFVMGDNRQYSEDSRFWEQPYISRIQIIGKVLYVF